MKWVYFEYVKSFNNQILKTRGYFWDGKKKAWRKKVELASKDEENFAEKNSDLGKFSAKEIDLEDNFKD